MNRRQTTSANNSTKTAPIDPALLYELRDALGRLGWGDLTLRRAKQAGLPIIRFGKRRYVRGGDICALFDRLADEGGAT